VIVSVNDVDQLKDSVFDVLPDMKQNVEKVTDTYYALFPALCIRSSVAVSPLSVPKVRKN